jgi:predicted nucleotidyltransferase
MDTKRAIADQHTILRTQVGSGLHGTAISGQDDRDEMGICVEPPEYVLGLERFDQYEFRSQPTGVRSGPGDLDLVVYGLKKWMRLAVAGNPTIILPLFAPESEVLVNTPYGERLRQQVPTLLSRQCADRYRGYLESQRARLMGLKSTGTNRPELIELYGFDTKYAMHMVRLGIQGIELLTTGRITLPVPAPHLTLLRDIRVGKLTMQETLVIADEFDAELLRLRTESPLPEEVDRAKTNELLIEIYEAAWHTKPDPIVFPLSADWPY